jgi:hypothetical protein
LLNPNVFSAMNPENTSSSHAAVRLTSAKSNLSRQAAILAAALLVLSAPTVRADLFIYNLVNDWSDTQNPHGSWSYNYNNAPIAVFQTFWWGQPGWGYYSIGDGCIIRGSAPTGTDPYGNVVPPANDWQPGDVMMHALSLPYGGASTFLNVTWTSPAAGTIDIDGRAWDGLIISGRDVAWSLSVGGQTIAQRSSVFGLSRSDAGAQFSSNLSPSQALTGIPVSQGEVVEFLVATDTYYGEFVGVQENITLTTVPEPSGAALFLVGCAAFFGCCGTLRPGNCGRTPPPPKSTFTRI